MISMRLICFFLTLFCFSFSLHGDFLERFPEPCRHWLVSWSPRIFLIENFLSPEDCDLLIEQARPHLSPSMVVIDDAKTLASHPGRTSKGAFFPKNKDNALVRRIEARIALLTMLPKENGEDLQVLRYGVEDQYLPHYDFFDPSTQGGRICLRRGGQRITSVLIYLNTPEEGGETFFPEVGIHVQPIKGNALIIHNCTPDGLEDPLSLHGGAPVIKGEKWLAVTWIRQNKFE